MKMRWNIMKAAFCAAGLCLVAPLAFAAAGGFTPRQGEAPPQTGGFTGSPALVGVAEAKKLSDDSYVRLRGNILRRVGKDDYEFSDGKNSITVEIDHDKWRGQTVSPTDLVEIEGEIDQNLTNTEIDVERVTLIAPK